MTEQSNPPDVAARPVAAVFDLDKTITRRATYIPFLLSVARHDPHKLLWAAPIVTAALAYKTGLVSRGRVKEIMLGAVLGKASRAEVAAHAKAFVAECITRGLRPGAWRAISIFPRSPSPASTSST